MNDLSVTVVIPAYRAAHTIRRAVDSVLTQSWPAHEIIVIDDGSPDDIAAAVRPYGDRVTFLRKANGGTASARNAGIDAATGDVIAFLDADDFWDPEKLVRQVEVFREHSELGIVGASFIDQTPQGARRVVDLQAMIGKNTRLDEVLYCTGELAVRIGCALWTGTVAVRRSALGDHRFVSGLEPAEDRDLWIRLAAAAPVYLISTPLATVVLEPGSISRTNIDRDYGNMLRVLDRHQSLLPRGKRRRWEADVYGRWAGVALSQGNYRQAVRKGWQRVRREPFRPAAWWILAKSGLLAAVKPQLPREYDRTLVSDSSSLTASRQPSLEDRELALSDTRRTRKN